MLMEWYTNFSKSLILRYSALTQSSSTRIDVTGLDCFYIRTIFFNDSFIDFKRPFCIMKYAFQSRP